MTSDNDKKAAEEWADDNIDACCGTSDIFLSAAKAFLAGCKYKEKEARAEVILKLRNLVNEEDYYDGGETWGEYTVPHWKDVKMLQDAINEFLTKLERGAE